MRTLTGTEAAAVRILIEAAVVEGARAQCLRSRCGAVVAVMCADSDQGVGARVLGVGHNSPPDGCTPEHCAKDDLPAAFRSDRTCCVHAEQNAILDALHSHPTEVADATMVFIRLDEMGEPKPSGQPYCTICSKLSQAAGLAEFVLWHGPGPEEGLVAYGCDEYNRLSFHHADD